MTSRRQFLGAVAAGSAARGRAETVPATVEISEERMKAHYKDQYDQMDRYYDRLLDESYQERKRRWHKDFSSPAAYEKSIGPNRLRFQKMLAAFHSTGPLKPESHLLMKNDDYSLSEVTFTAIEGVQVFGYLLVPAKIDGKRPALICCHGYGGRPEQVVGIAGAAEPNHYLRNFGVTAAKEGYVVFAPLQMHDQPTRTWLDRKAIVIGQRLFGLEMNKIMRSVDYLAELPQVRADRIGIYGISNGGRTALFAAALDRRLKVSVVSGMFNNTTPKLTKPSKKYLSFIETPEDHIYFYDQCNEFSDSDIAALICPRGLFVEAGREDKVFDVDLLQQEFALVHENYSLLGIADRAQLGLFDGPHVIHGKGSFPFIRRWLFEA